MIARELLDARARLGQPYYQRVLVFQSPSSVSCLLGAVGSERVSLAHPRWFDAALGSLSGDYLVFLTTYNVRAPAR